MYSIKQLSAGEGITYDFSPQIELLKSAKVFRLNIDDIGATMSFFLCFSLARAAPPTADEFLVLL